LQIVKKIGFFHFHSFSRLCTTLGLLKLICAYSVQK